MQLAYAMTALAAEVTPDGKLWMLGGDFDTLTAQSFPVTHPAIRDAISGGAASAW